MWFGISNKAPFSMSDVFCGCLGSSSDQHVHGPGQGPRLQTVERKAESIRVETIGVEYIKVAHKLYGQTRIHWITFSSFP